MKKTTRITLLVAALLSTTASAQEFAGDRVLTHADATAHFRKGDSDSNGTISRAEARGLGITAEQAAKYDYNNDSQIDPTEFAVAYHAMALAGGAKVGDDLGKQVQRELDKRRLAEKKAADAAQAKENREAIQKRIDESDRAKAKNRQDAQDSKDAKEIEEARRAGEKRKDGTERAEAKKIAEARAAAAKRKAAVEAARKRADAERRKKKDQERRKKDLPNGQ